jgi:hypothetical protein
MSILILEHDVMRKLNVMFAGRRRREKSNEMKRTKLRKSEKES